MRRVSACRALFSAESTFFGAASQTTTPRLCTVLNDDNLPERENQQNIVLLLLLLRKKKRKSLWNEPCEKTVWEMLWEKLREAEFEVEEDEDKERFVNLEGRFSNEHETDAISILFLIPSFG
ncbi:30S ribosomal protein S20, chloroplastic [Trifolium repens]|nr:30S ribosomal protein S20, chloroplastic [Trifolium repens]